MTWAVRNGSALLSWFWASSGGMIAGAAWCHSAVAPGPLWSMVHHGVQQ
ncbi:hypothetical protein [Streptomyces odonnellii]|nr:hypothetical protein [Streptomyces odonnellii]